MRVNWFEIPVADMQRAKAFYAACFDIEMGEDLPLGTSTMSFFPSEKDEQGATGTLIQQDSYVPSHEGSMVYFSVRSIDAIIPRIASAGGKVLNPKMSIGAHGFVAHFEDTEGNRAALHEAAS